MTIEYDIGGATDANSNCTPAVTFNKKFQSGQGATDMLRTVPPLTTEISHALTSDVGSPNSAFWPSGDYTGQIAVPLNAGVMGTIQLLRVLNGTCAIQDTLGTSGSFSGTGQKSFTVAATPGAGNLNDRYQMRIKVTNGNPIISFNFSVRPTTDTIGTSLGRGPWAPTQGIQAYITRRQRDRRHRM